MECWANVYKVLAPFALAGNLEPMLANGAMAMLVIGRWANVGSSYTQPMLASSCWANTGDLHLTNTG